MSAHDSNSSSAQDAEIQSKAAEWLARRDRGFSSQDQAEFHHWLAQDPRHQIAVAELEVAWSALDDLAALRPAPNATDVDPDLLAQKQAKPRGRRSHEWLAPLAIAASLILVVSAWSWLRHGAGAPRESVMAYETQVAEQRKVTLPDGSVIELNTHSAIEARFNGQYRRVRLIRGEAFFAVAKDAQHPFIVDAETVAVRAVGTAFDVYRRDAQTEVTVTEGVVRLEGDTSPNDAPTISAGNRALVESRDGKLLARISAASPDELKRLLAWREGNLVFDSAPLSTVIAEFNRYNERQLQVTDPSLAATPVGGVFKVQDLDAFVRMLSTTLDIVAEHPDAKTILLHRASP